MVNPLLPSEFWGVTIGLYLFLGGMAGGAHVTGVVADFLRARDEQRRAAYHTTALWGMIVGLVAIAIGGLLLLSHLGEPQHVVMFWLFTNVESWMTIGVWIIVVFSVLSLLQTLWIGFGSDGWFRRGPDLVDRAADALRPSERIRRGLAAFGAVVGLVLIVYTALLLSAAGETIPLWNGTWLPPLFLASGLSMGIAATVGITTLLEGAVGTGVREFSIADDVVILGEIVVLGALFVTLSGGNETAVETYNYILNDGWLLFWGGVVAVGLALPLVLSGGLLLAERRFDVHGDNRLRRLARAGYALKFGFVVFGGLALRLVIVLGALNVPAFGV